MNIESRSFEKSKRLKTAVHPTPCRRSTRSQTRYETRSDSCWRNTTTSEWK